MGEGRAMQEQLPRSGSFTPTYGIYSFRSVIRTTMNNYAEVKT